MRLVSTAAALLCFALPASAEETVSPKDGKFSVRFPSKPKENTQTVKTDAGRVKVYTATYAQPDGGTFVATFAELPGDTPDALLDGAIKSLSKDAKSVDRKDIEIGKDKEKGREVVIDKGKQQIRYRLVVRENRLIQVGVIGSADFIKGKGATAFLDSLDFTK